MYVYFVTGPLALPQFENSELGNLRFLVSGSGQTFHDLNGFVLFSCNTFNMGFKNP